MSWYRDHSCVGATARTRAHKRSFDRNDGRGARGVLRLKSPRQLAARIHPLLSIPIYVATILVIYLVLAHITRLFLGRLDDLPTLYKRLPYVLIFFRCIP